MALSIVGSKTLLNTVQCLKRTKFLPSSVFRLAPLVSNSSPRYVSVTHPVLKKERVNVTFVKANGEKITAEGKEGDSLLDIVVNNEVDIEGYGACEGTLTCSTCHLILKKEDYDSLPSKPTDEELDMLDLAYELTDTSRLGCQIIMTKELNGLEVKVPASVNDARS